MTDQQPPRRRSRYLVAAAMAAAVLALTAATALAPATASASTSRASTPAAVVAQIVPAHPGSRAASPPPCNTASSLTPLPVSGDLTNPEHTRAGFYYAASGRQGEITCIGTLREWVRYTATATKTWRVHIYDPQFPHGHVIATVTFRLGPGYYFWDFAINQDFGGLLTVCTGASGTPGFSCVAGTALA